MRDHDQVAGGKRGALRHDLPRLCDAGVERCDALTLGRLEVGRQDTRADLVPRATAPLEVWPSCQVIVAW